MENKKQPIAVPKNFVMWVGELYLNQKVVEEQVDLANQEIIKLNGLLSTCKCERKEDEKK